MRVLIGYIIGCLVCYFTLDYKGFINKKPPEIKPCLCVTYSQYALWQAKYDMYVDKNKPDSVAKYAKLLNQIK